MNIYKIDQFIRQSYTETQAQTVIMSRRSLVYETVVVWLR